MGPPPVVYLDLSDSSERKNIDNIPDIVYSVILSTIYHCYEHEKHVMYKIRDMDDRISFIESFP